MSILGIEEYSILRVVGYGSARITADVLVETVHPYPFNEYIIPVWPAYPFGNPFSHYYVVRVAIEFNLQEL